MHFQLPDDLAIWQNRVREFVRTELQPHDQAIEETGHVPDTAIAGLRKMGLFGTNTPKEHGGLGLSMLGSCLAIEEVAKAHAAYYYLSDPTLQELLQPLGATARCITFSMAPKPILQMLTSRVFLRFSQRWTLDQAPRESQRLQSMQERRDCASAERSR